MDWQTEQFFSVLNDDFKVLSSNLLRKQERRFHLTRKQEISGSSVQGVPSQRCVVLSQWNLLRPVLFKLPALQFIRLVFHSGAKNIAPIWNLLIVSLDTSKLVLANLISLTYR
jgi:hypothetical protein